ncbi:hypothetical protein LWI28_013554 [Acer negundo]|uniref:Integrase catalytic domain-containing protein n=1 Tax=Acer negundo TaxID=4023 RepID=A0AAD5I8T9_ACENE|nr:hypothetical protein LWI28_013554 [Acer negundo]
MGLLQPLSIPEKIWKDLTTDFVEGLPSSGGYELILGSKLKASFSYHPQTDGQTEVVNQTLEQYLMCYCYWEQKRWKKYISWAEYWYNTSHHASINMSPFEVMYGRPPPMLITYEKGTARNEEVERELIARDEVVAKVKKELEKAHGRMKKYYDQGRRDVSFELGDFMYLKLQPYRQKSLKKKFNVKLSQRYYRPFKVLERIGEVAYKLELPSTSRLHLVFHVTMLKKRVGNSSLISSDLPAFDTEGNLLIRPIIALGYRNWKKGCGMTKVWQVLVQWQGVLTEEATWEDYDEMVERFPDFSLEDKSILEERGNVETVRKSKIIMERRSGTAVQTTD